MKIMFRIYRYMRQKVNSIKIKLANSMFRQNANVGDGFSVGESARCQNESGNKNNIVIGNNVQILGVLLSEGGGGIIKIGNYTTIRADSRICSINSIDIGDYVIISNNVVIQDNNSHPVNMEIRKKMSLDGPGTELWKSSYSDSAPIVIEDSVWVGEKAVILKGVHIGKGSIVACNAVVTKDVPPNCIVAGNPARVVKKINDNQ